MELRDLEYFLACIDQGSVTAAAKRVHAAQPTISHALARLEREVGERLIERRPRSPQRITQAGELLASRARSALGALGAFRFDLAELRGAVRGGLRIASIQSLNATFLPDVLVRFLRKYPDVQVEALTYPAETIARRIADGLEHVGIVAGPLSRPGAPVSHQFLFKERFAVVVPRSHAFARYRSVAVSKLQSERLVLVPESSFTGAAIGDAFGRAGIAPHVVMSIASTEALCEAVKRGIGVTVLPESYQVRSSYGLCSIALRDPIPTRDVGLLMPGDEVATAAAKAFRALLLELTRSRRDGPAS